MLMTKKVIAKVQADYPEHEQASVLEYISLYGAREGELEIEKVRLAILTLAAGDKEQILALIRDAKANYTDILARV